jgi:DtxR family Mn-dependent transcriptional regulator
MSLSKQEEDYLKALLLLEERSEDHGRVSTNAMARSMGVQAASVTDMLKKLSASGLVHYKPYQGVLLSETGRSAAIKVLRKHRLWETFLVQELRFGWAQVHEIAEQLEHVQSDMLIDRLDQYLEYPAFDPHGEPIPDRDGKFPGRESRVLWASIPGESLRISGVLEDSEEFLTYLCSQGISMGTPLVILEIEPYDDSIVAEVAGCKIRITRKAAEQLLVSTYQ